MRFLQKTTVLACLSIMTSVVMLAQASKKQMDREAILSMQGCYEITFDYAETFGVIRDYEYHDRYKAKAKEWVQVLADDADHISLQHLLIANDTMIIKHWRQDWVYENTDFYMYDHDRKWKYVSMTPEQVKGQWTQKVYQVDDSPRYEGSASWVHVDGRHFWNNTTDAPLPRREATKRKDYNVMQRTNHHEVYGDHWVHNQDNAKVLRSADGDQIIAYEKGMNVYTKVDDDVCKAAQHWWIDNRTYWGGVVDVWNDIYGQKQNIKMKKKVDNQFLFMHVFMSDDVDHAREMIGKYVERY